MKGNKHLSLEERSKISVLQSSGESVRSIARILGR
ncbi:helix-turn-helix domain-containing protein, partial [bacterium]|nr:helix-turn-helix domain-containing protein [bacterium]